MEIPATSKRDACFAGFAGVLAALVSWLLFAPGHMPADGLTLWLCISLPLLAVGSALLGTRRGPYGFRASGYWGAARVICLLFPALTGVVVPAPFLLAFLVIAVTYGEFWALVGMPVFAVSVWFVSFFVALLVATPVCIVGVAAFHGLLRLLRRSPN